MKEPLNAFKAARFFSPFKLQQMQPSAVSVDSLFVFPSYLTPLIPWKMSFLAMKLLRKTLTLRTTHLNFGSDTRTHCLSGLQLPWKSYLCKPLRLLLSVFSLLTNSFSDRQNTALQDYIETSIMLQYNGHWHDNACISILKLCSVCLDLCMCSTFIIGSLQHKIGIIGCTSRNNRDILWKIWCSIIRNFINIIGSGLSCSQVIL